MAVNQKASVEFVYFVVKIIKIIACFLFSNKKSKKHTHPTTYIYIYIYIFIFIYLFIYLFVNQLGLSAEYASSE